MTYDKWADDYLKSAKDTEKMIRRYRAKMGRCRDLSLRMEYARKLKAWEDMYEDCVCTAGILRRKADRLRQCGMQNMIVREDVMI